MLELADLIIKWGLTSTSKYVTTGKKQGKVTDGCKKHQDTSVIIMTRNSNLKDVTDNSKELSFICTYTRDKYVHIQNTTNSLDAGVFFPMKILIKVYR